jgi:programmed cell death 8 (apoptosis-inducing factor)
VESTAEPRTPKESDEFGKGVVLYLKNEKIVGVLLWNVFKAVPIARQVFDPNLN